MGNDRLGGWWLAGAGGLLAGLALPPLGWPPLLWLALAGLWALSGSLIGVRGGALWGGAAGLVVVLTGALFKCRPATGLPYGSKSKASRLSS